MMQSQPCHSLIQVLHASSMFPGQTPGLPALMFVTLWSSLLILAAFHAYSQIRVDVSKDM